MALQIVELLALQALDTEIGKLNQEREALDHGDRVERALAVRQAKLESAERRVHGLEVEQRNAELELKSLDEKKHQTSQKLYNGGKVTAPRELQGLELEVQMLERQRQRLDETMVRRIDEVEGAKKVVETAQAAVDEADKALKIVRRRYEKEAERIQSDLATRTPKRAKLVKKLNADILRRYDDIRRRSHNLAAVRIDNGACGGCRMKVGGALLRRVLTQDTYVYCESCSRFLFPAAEA